MLSVLRPLWPFLLRYRRAYLVGALCIVASIWLKLQIPRFFWRALDTLREMEASGGSIDAEATYVKDLSEVRVKVHALGGDQSLALNTFNGDFGAVREFLKSVPEEAPPAGPAYSLWSRDGRRPNDGNCRDASGRSRPRTYRASASDSAIRPGPPDAAPTPDADPTDAELPDA